VRADLQAAGIGQVVAVQAIASRAETRELLELAARDPLIGGVVGWLDLARPDAAGQLRAAQAGPGGAALVGARHQLQTEPDPGWLDRPLVRAGLRALAAAGLTWDLVISPGQLPLVTGVAAALPEVRFVLDHAGKPPIASGDLAAWAADLARLAVLPNVAVKLSGLVTEADWAAWRPADLRPAFDRALGLFGPGRAMFGSDWPVCLLAASYARVADAIGPVLDGLTAADRRAVLGGAARAWYQLPAAGAGPPAHRAVPPARELAEDGPRPKTRR
jgi:L-fuconolactonase